MNKKLTLTAISVLVFFVGFFGIKTINNKDIQKSSKIITIDIISNVDNLNEKEEIKTDEDKLGSVLSTKEGFKIKNGMVVMVKNIDLSNSDSEYWHISINGEDAKVGANDKIIKNGDNIKFERIKFR